MNKIIGFLPCVMVTFLLEPSFAEEPAKNHIPYKKKSPKEVQESMEQAYCNFHVVGSNLEGQAEINRKMIVQRCKCLYFRKNRERIDPDAIRTEARRECETEPGDKSM